MVYGGATSATDVFTVSSVSSWITPVIVTGGAYYVPIVGGQDYELLASGSGSPLSFSSSSVFIQHTCCTVSASSRNPAIYRRCTTKSPTTEPTTDPTKDPTNEPTIDPTSNPTTDPTKDPTNDPTNEPTRDPTGHPTSIPTFNPSVQPTNPTTEPTNGLTAIPTSLSNYAAGVVATTTSESIQATKIVYRSQESDSFINVQSLTTSQLTIGMMIIMTCCIGPLLIVFCTCYCLYKKRHTLQNTTAQTKSDVEKQPESHQNQPKENEKDQNNDKEVSKIGLSATDSLKLQPDNYSFTPSGPKLIVIDANSKPTPQNQNIPGSNPSKPALGNIGSDNSSAIYENVEHEYDMNTREKPKHGYNGQIEMTDGQKTLKLTNLSTVDNNKMSEILECYKSTKY